MTRLTPEVFRKALDHLVAVDPHLAEIRAAHGDPPLRARPPGFAALLQIIVDQQVSVAAARAIWSRLEAAMGEPSPAAFLALDYAALRACGLSRGKVIYARGLASDIVEGRVNLDALEAMEDEAAIAELVKIKGIGRWSAEVYLLTTLARADVWPVDDLAVATATGKVKGFRVRPKRRTLIRLAETWRPYRSVAARLMWHYFRNVLMTPNGGTKHDPARHKKRGKQGTKAAKTPSKAAKRKAPARKGKGGKSAGKR